MIATDDPRHGRRAGYIAGCRETCCSDAHRRYCKQYKLRALKTGSTTVPVSDLRPHLDRVLERMSLTAAASAAGMSSGWLSRVMRGTIQRVHYDTAQALLAITVDKVPDTQYVNAFGAMRRLQSLHALGYSMQRIDELIGGYGKQNLDLVARGKRTQITVAWDRRIRAAWDRHAMTPPTARNHYEQAGITKSLARAQRFGWLPPLAWDDIDNPAERPAIVTNIRSRGDVDEVVVQRLLDGKRTDATKAERDEAMRRWKRVGGSERSLCLMHGWKDTRYGKGDAA